MIGELIRSSYPKLVLAMGEFLYPLTFDIGFVNPFIDKHEDGIANDETELTAESLADLEELYEGFCLENDFPTDTIKYIEIVDEYCARY